MILTYLIPCHLITTHTLPSEKLLEPYPRLQKLFLPLSQCIKKGDLHAFDVALQKNEDEFVRQRIYLTLERGRDIALRNLLRKVFLAGGFEEPTQPGAVPVRRTRVPVANFSTAIKLGSQESLDDDEVECLLANMIYKVSLGIRRCHLGWALTRISIHAEPHEGIHPPREGHCGTEQGSCVPWNRYIRTT